MRVLLFGPTAAGKTALAVELAEALGGEVVNSDSRLLYRGMDVGTAKPTEAERRGVPHHVIDVADPDRRVTAGEWRRLALEATEDLGTRGAAAVLAGGTGFYAKILLAGWDLGELPPDEESRREMAAAEAAVPGSLHRRLAEVDPGRAAELSPADVQRLTRALELARHGVAPGEVEPLSCLAVGLEAAPDWLAGRIDLRVEEMAAAGLREEAEALWERWPESPVLPATIGYAEFAPGAEGDPWDAIRLATKGLARRQRTWLRSLPLDLRLDASQGAGRLAAEVAGAL